MKEQSGAASNPPQLCPSLFFYITTNHSVPFLSIPCHLQIHIAKLSPIYNSFSVFHQSLWPCPSLTTFPYHPDPAEERVTERMVFEGGACRWQSSKRPVFTSLDGASPCFCAGMTMLYVIDSSYATQQSKSLYAWLAVKAGWIRRHGRHKAKQQQVDRFWDFQLKDDRNTALGWNKLKAQPALDLLFKRLDFQSP